MARDKPWLWFDRPMPSGAEYNARMEHRKAVAKAYDAARYARIKACPGNPTHRVRHRCPQCCPTLIDTAEET
jgi:hypothetical protein